MENEHIFVRILYKLLGDTATMLSGGTGSPTSRSIVLTKHVIEKILQNCLTRRYTHHNSPTRAPRHCQLYNRVVPWN